MTTEQIKSLNIGIDTDNATQLIMAQSAVEWLENNTTIDTEDIENFPARAKAFISKFCEIFDLRVGVSSENINGLSQSFTNDKKDDLIWDFAKTLLATDIKSQIQFIPVKRRWI